MSTYLGSPSIRQSSEKSLSALLLISTFDLKVSAAETRSGSSYSKAASALAAQCTVCSPVAPAVGRNRATDGRRPASRRHRPSGRRLARQKVSALATGRSERRFPPHGRGRLKRTRCHLESDRGETEGTVGVFEFVICIHAKNETRVCRNTKSRFFISVKKATSKSGKCSALFEKNIS